MANPIEVHSRDQHPLTHVVNIQQQDDPLIDRYVSFIDSFDGSSDAFERAEPIMAKVFHPDVKFHMDHGIHDLQWYADFAKSFAEQGHSARVVHARRIDDASMEVSIRNTIDGVDMDLIWYRAGVGIDPISGESVLVDFAPMTTAADVEGCSELVRHVAERDGGNASNVQDACASGDDIYFVCKHILRRNRRESFEHHARKVVSDMNGSRGDDGTLSFQMYFPTDSGDDVDQSTCHLIEHYRNSTAAAAHVRSMRKNQDRNKAINDCADIECLEVYGAASVELKEVLKEETYPVVYFGPSRIGVTRG